MTPKFRSLVEASCGREPELVAVEAEDVAEFLGRVSDAEDLLAQGVEQLAGAVAEVLERLDPGVPDPHQRVALRRVDDPVRVLGQLGCDDVDGFVDGDQRGADPDGDPAGLVGGEVPDLRVGDRVGRHLADELGLRLDLLDDRLDQVSIGARCRP